MANKKHVRDAVAITGALVPTDQIELQPGRTQVFALILYTEGTEASVDIGVEVRPDNDSNFVAADWFRYTGPMGSGVTSASEAVWRFTPTGVPATVSRRCLQFDIPAHHMARLTVLGNTIGGGPGLIDAWLVQSV